MDTSHAPESFRGLLLRHRGRTRLIQRDVAARAGVSLRSVQDWESGVNYPTAERLQAIILVLLESGGLTVGHETAEARELWAAAEREAPRMRTPFDDQWFERLLAAHLSSTSKPAGDIRHEVPAAADRIGAVERAQDWGDAPDILGFVGRADELAQLRRWILDEGCRLVALLGMGGIGKTSVAARLAQDVAPNFERVYWRSLRDAPPVSEWLAGAIAFLSDQQLVPPSAESDRIAALLRLLRERRCLLVLDNSETLFEPGQREVRYRAGMVGYGHLLKAVGDASHQSCVVVTSREAPSELALLTGVRELELHGLGVAEGQAVLADKQLSGDPRAWLDLVDRYGGNGLALKIVGETIRQLFDGDIVAFLGGEAITTYGSVFGGIRRLLDVQAERLSPVERDVLTRLAVEREPLTVAELSRELAQSVDRSTVIEAIETLRRRSLVERGDRGATFTLQSMVLEYVTDRLVEAVAQEIEHGRPLVLVAQPLIKAQANEYVRQTQERLIGEPILQRLMGHGGEAGTHERLLVLLERWRGRPPEEQGCGPGNLVNLLRLLRGELRGLDLSRLAIRQAYLADVEAQDARLVDAHLAETVLAEAFDFPGSIAVSGDGALLAAGTSTGLVWLWRVADRTPLWAVASHTGGVWGVALSADGRLVASGGDGTVRLWEASNGRPIATLKGHTGTVYHVALSADGGLVASGGFDRTVRLWETRTGQSIATLKGHTGTVWRVALSADGQLVASSSEDGTVRLWEVGTGRPLATLQGHTGTVYGVALSADGGLAASGGFDGTVQLWAGSGQPVATLQGHTRTVWSVSLSPDGQLAASSGEDGTVRLWEVSSGRPIATLQGHTGAVWGVVLCPEGHLVASSGEDGTVRLWELSTGRAVATLQGHTHTVWGVALSADGQLVASGGTDGTVRVWEACTGRRVATLQGHTGAAYSVAMSANGQLVASGGTDGTVRVWEAGTERQVATLQGSTGTVRGVALSADGRLVTSGAGDGTVRLWEVSTGQLVATLQGHTGAIFGMALGADGQLIASGGDGTVRLWEASTGRPLAILKGDSGGVLSVGLSAAGRLVASGGEDGTVRLWETGTGQPVATLQGHTGTVRGVALSADGELVGSGGEDGTVRVWETGTGQPVATLEGHTGAVWCVALSADGQRVASGSFDGTVKLWEVRSGTCLRTLRPERRYERMDITGLTGVTDAQQTALLALGAVEQHTPVRGPSARPPLDPVR